MFVATQVMLADLDNLSYFAETHYLTIVPASFVTLDRHHITGVNSVPSIPSYREVVRHMINPAHPAVAFHLMVQPPPSYWLGMLIVSLNAPQEQKELASPPSATYITVTNIASNTTFPKPGTFMNATVINAINVNTATVTAATSCTSSVDVYMQTYASISINLIAYMNIIMSQMICCSLNI